MRTDVKIGVALGLVVVIIAVVYFLLFGPTDSGEPIVAGNGEQERQTTRDEPGEDDSFANDDRWEYSPPPVDDDRSEPGADRGGLSVGLIDDDEDDAESDPSPPPVDPSVDDDPIDDPGPGPGDFGRGIAGDVSLPDEGRLAIDDPDAGRIAEDDDIVRVRIGEPLDERRGSSGGAIVDDGAGIVDNPLPRGGRRTGGIGPSLGSGDPREDGARPEEWTYVVQEGDHGFTVIAGRDEVYGDSSKWKHIQDANPDVSSRSLRVGQKLTIRRLPAEVAARSGETRLERMAREGTVVESINGLKHYIVKADDAGGYWSVAKAAYGKATPRLVKIIQDANPQIEPTALRPGMKVLIPDVPDEPTAETGTASGGSGDGPAGPEPAGDQGQIIETVTGDRYYIVKPGDRGFVTAAEVAYNNGNLWMVIQKANPDLDPRRLQPGDRVKVPDKPATLPRITGGSPVRPSGDSGTEDSSARRRSRRPRPSFRRRLDEMEAD